MKGVSRLKNKIIKYRDKQPSSSDLSGWKTAVILLTALLILTALGLIGFFAYRCYSLKNESSTDEPSYDHVSSISAGDKKKLLRLVSAKQPLTPEEAPALTDYQSVSVDALIVEDLDALMQAARQSKLSLLLTGGYVSEEEQNERYQAEVERLMDETRQTRAGAEEEAQKNVPAGGCADEQLGLSVTFASGREIDFVRSDEYFWLRQHSYEFGFILRYPENKTAATEQAFRPELFRYVGRENARRMQILNMCLDEYMVYLDAR